MSAGPIRTQSPDDEELARALMLLFALPQETIDSIGESMRTLKMGFVEAALHTGLVTQTELDLAQKAVQRPGGGGANRERSIVEDALRRNASRRDLVVWEGERLLPGRELILAHDPDNPRSEAIRSLRTELLMRSSGRQNAGVFALLSPGAGEGRSQLAAELAIAFAQLGSRTLLVDADMRRPRQHALFCTENAVGLAQALVDSNTLRVHGVEGVPQLAVLISGGVPPNPLELLSGMRFERIVGEWRRSYEFVVIDTPPTSLFSDALAVATAAGSVVVLGRRNSTSFNSLTELRRKLDTTRARVVGAVINSF
jgi:receptor protein-tyrosine kinase